MLLPCGDWEPAFDPRQAATVLQRHRSMLSLPVSLSRWLSRSSKSHLPVCVAPCRHDFLAVCAPVTLGASWPRGLSLSLSPASACTTRHTFYVTFSARRPVQ